MAKAAAKFDHESFKIGDLADRIQGFFRVHGFEAKKPTIECGGREYLKEGKRVWRSSGYINVSFQEERATGQAGFFIRAITPWFSLYLPEPVYSAWTEEPSAWVLWNLPVFHEKEDRPVTLEVRYAHFDCGSNGKSDRYRVLVADGRVIRDRVEL